MQILKKLYSFDIPIPYMVQIYCLYMRSVAEQSSVVWGSSLTKGQEFDLERIQKVALRIILDKDYISYENALNTTNLKTLKDRRSDLSLNFARKCTRNIHTMNMFPLNTGPRMNRNSEKYEVTQATTARLANSAIPTMQRQLNLNC